MQSWFDVKRLTLNVKNVNPLVSVERKRYVKKRLVKKFRAKDSVQVSRSINRQQTQLQGLS